MFTNCVYSQETSKSSKVKSATVAIEEWLSIVDSGNYSQSWQEAGSIFKNQITDSQWVSAVSKVREPLGKLVSRKRLNAEYMTSLPSVPDGEYVITIYKTQYEKKKKAKETVTAVFEDSQWKVVGYFIK
jgi:hypothetical protein